MLCIPGIAKKSRNQINVESKHTNISIWRLLNHAALTIIYWVLNLFLTTYHLASTTDKGVTPIADRSLPHWLPAINRYKFTTLRIPASRKLGHNIQSSVLGSWGTVARMWKTTWGRTCVWDMEREGEQISEDYAGTDIFEGFSTLDFLWASIPRCRLISQQDFFCRRFNGNTQRPGRHKRSRAKLPYSNHALSRPLWHFSTTFGKELEGG